MATRTRKVAPKSDDTIVETKKTPIAQKSCIPENLEISSDGKVTLTVEQLLSLLKDNAVLKNKEEDSKLKIDDMIEVISLTPSIVNANVSPTPKQPGRNYRFDKFGKVLQIPYSDLMQIVQNHTALFEKGYLYINDARFVKAAGLQGAVENMLTKEQIQQIVYSDSPDYMELFAKATTEQRKNIAGILIDEINAGKEFDMNKLDKISKFIGYDILERANKQKEAFKKPVVDEQEEE